MDMTTMQALRVVLQEAECEALERVRLDFERSSMQREDFAARGIMGRFAANCHFKSSVQSRYWVQSFHYLNDTYFDLERVFTRAQRRTGRVLESLHTLADASESVPPALQSAIMDLSRIVSMGEDIANEAGEEDSEEESEEED